MQKPFIELKGISHTYPKSRSYALNGINCSLQAGQIIGIIGPDGAGKTTLIRTITGILRPDIGECFVDGFSLTANKKIPDDLIRYMPQKFGLYEDLTVIENLNLYADLNCLDNLTKKNEIEKLLQFTRLNHFQDRLAQDLSGGMKQKLGLACTLLKKPKLLILDEPTVGVDPVSRKELWEIIYKLIEENITVICSTSYLDEAEKFSIVIVLKDGNCIYQGSPNFLKDKIIDRTFLLKTQITNKREILSQLILQPTVLDGIIHGDFLRILNKKNDVSSSIEFLKKTGTISSIAPSFEDAYFDLLPEYTKHRSPIYDLYPTFEKIDIPSVTAHNLTKKFGNFTAVNQISFEVKQGEIFGLLGPNGAGKSTTFKMLCGLIKTTFGESRIKNISLLNSPSEARSKVGYMAQKFSLYSHMTVLQNLNFFYGIYPIYNKKNNTVEEMIETFFLKPHLNTIAKDLPLGFKQRLALACSIMHRPEVLFLDEPTSGVDPITRREFWSHINALVSKNVAIIVTTHFMDEAEYCDRIGIVNQGNLIAIGTPEELKKKTQKDKLLLPTLEQTFIDLTKECSIL